MLLYSFPALSEAYTKNLKPYILPMGIPLTQVIIINKTKYFMTWLYLYDNIIPHLGTLKDCLKTAWSPRFDCLKPAWRSEPELWCLTDLDNFSLDRQMYKDFSQVIQRLSHSAFQNLICYICFVFMNQSNLHFWVYGGFS